MEKNKKWGKWMESGRNRIGERCDISEQARVLESELADECVVREFTEVVHSTLGTKVQLARMNQIMYSKIGSYTYTGQNTSILNTELGKFDSISWNVSIGGNTHDLDHVTTRRDKRTFRFVLFRIKLRYHSEIDGIETRSYEKFIENIEHLLIHYLGFDKIIVSIV